MRNSLVAVAAIIAIPTILWAVSPASVPTNLKSEPAEVVAAPEDNKAEEKVSSHKIKWQKLETEMASMPAEAKAEVEQYIGKVREANLLRQEAYNKLSSATKEFVKKHRIAIFHSAKRTATPAAAVEQKK